MAGVRKDRSLAYRSARGQIDLKPTTGRPSPGRTSRAAPKLSVSVSISRIFRSEISLDVAVAERSVGESKTYSFGARQLKREDAMHRALLFGIALNLFAGPALAQQVIAPSATIAGFSQETLGNQWWDWIAKTPTNVSPLYGDPTGANAGVNNSGPV